VASARAAAACRRYHLGTLFATATEAWRALFECSALSSLWPRQPWTNRGWTQCPLLQERDNAMLTSGNSADLLTVGRQNQPHRCTVRSFVTTALSLARCRHGIADTFLRLVGRANHSPVTREPTRVGAGTAGA